MKTSAPALWCPIAPAGDLLQSHPHLHILATDGGFSAPYPALNYFLEAAIFAPGNSFDLHPYLEVRPARTVAATAGVDLVWRFRTSDAIYRAGGGILVSPGASGACFVTAITQLDGSWQPLPQIALRAAWVWASAGAVV